MTGHQYISELGDAAMRMARRRRNGEDEDLETEKVHLLELQREHRLIGGFAGIGQAWRNSLYSADRYYGFGCRELCDDHFESARRCFGRSLRTNCLFVKSWIGLTLSLLPPIATRLKFLFRSSMQQQNEARPERRESAEMEAVPVAAGDSSSDR